jgi:protein-S-isoprenylcysteine O-methyltransferase Ste14
MHLLELLVPPPIVALIIAGAMWGVSSIPPVLELPPSVRIASALTIAFVGLCFDIAGLLSFLRARTTINPLRPTATSSLVSTGVYRMTRNPMYLGLLLFLIAWAVFLASVWALLGPLCFVLYMNRFQIGPEEKALASMFGSSYSEYKSRVRRWL